MTVLFVLLLFAVFIALDAWSHRREALPVAAVASRSEPEAFHVDPVWVGGYLVPDGLHYHRGHTWVRALTADTAVVGVDDFARRLIGPVSRAELPAAGDWLRSGDRAANLGLDGREAGIVAPIDGQVIETNPLLERSPELATADPYGRGWLFKLRSPDLARGLKNLFNGTLAHRFAEDAKERLQLELMALSGSVLADGGEPAADFARHLTDEEWRRLTGEFLLS